jgi:hypothetical protein
MQDVFGKGLQRELLKKNINISLLDFGSLILMDEKENILDKYAKLYSNSKFHPKFKILFRMWIIKKIVQEIGADIINIHVSRWFYLMILPWISRQGLIVTLYGSDFYRTSVWVKVIQTILYSRADAITFTNPVTRSSFLSFYKKFNNKSHVCRFGLDALDFIDENKEFPKIDLKRKIGFSTEKIIVTCGYNSTKAQQHEKIISAILKLPTDVLAKFQFIFPLTYGDTDWRIKVKKILNKTQLDYICLEKFLYSDENAYIKIASDIMINTLETDSFSGSMQEYLYANNVVMAGSWLPYDVFDKAGVKYIKINDFKEINTLLMNFARMGINKFDTTGNDKVIGELSRWACVIDSWLGVYKNVEQSLE